MKKPKDLEIFIGHILDNIEKIEKDLNGLNEEDFSISDTIQDATVRRLEIIGEAVKNLPSSFREKYPDISWKEIAGMRDVLIHEYFGVDMGLVWKISIKDIPKLKKQILRIIKK